MVLITILLLGCSDKVTELNNDVEFPDLETLEYTFLMWYQEDDIWEESVWKAELKYNSIFGGEPSVNFRFNGIIFHLNFEYDNEQWYTAIINLSEFELKFGNNVQIDLVTPSGSYTNKLQLPYPPRFTTPNLVIYPDEDLTVKWELEKDPLLQNLYLYISTYDGSYTQYNYLNRKIREFTYLRSELPNNIRGANIYLECVNFIIEEKNIFVASIGAQL